MSSQPKSPSKRKQPPAGHEDENVRKMEADTLQEILLSRDPRMVRPAWKPNWLKKPTGRPQATKFGGLPYQKPGFEWPKCRKSDCRMTFLLQLEASMLPQKARELSTLKTGLLQVFAKCHDSCEHSRIVPEEELVSSPRSMTASELLTKGRELSALPDQIVGKIKAQVVKNEEGKEGIQVAGWDEIGKEVPLPEELYMAMAEEGLIEKKPMIEFGMSHIYKMSPAWIKWCKMCFGGKGSIKPEEMLADEHREEMGKLNFPEEPGSYTVGEQEGEGYPDIKLGGWIHWFHELGGDINYPLCPDCKVKMTAPLLTFKGSDKIPNSYVGFEGDGTTLITLCPTCQRVGIHDIQDLYSVEVNMIL